MNAKKDIKTKLEQLTLLLIYMSSWEEREHKTLPPVRRAWKGYDFDTLNDLEDQGYRNGRLYHRLYNLSSIRQ